MYPSSARDYQCRGGCDRGENPQLADYLGEGFSGASGEKRIGFTLNHGEHNPVSFLVLLVEAFETIPKGSYICNAYITSVGEKHKVTNSNDN